MINLFDMSWSPAIYNEQAIVAKEAAREMLDRLAFLSLQPKLLVAVGAIFEEISQQLQTQYFNTKIKQSNSVYDLQKFVLGCAEDTIISTENDSVDMIFANFFLPWQKDFITVLKEWRRVLQLNGLLIFSALGPDTLKEWRANFENTDIPQFMDMHDLGDLLLQNGFIDPVLEVMHYELSYKTKQKLVEELLLTGMWFPKNKDIVHQFIACQDSAPLTVTYEVIYVHAFVAGEKKQQTTDGLTNISIDSLRSSLRNKNA